jgi:hypothetical protein
MLIKNGPLLEKNYYPDSIMLSSEHSTMFVLQLTTLECLNFSSIWNDQSSPTSRFESGPQKTSILTASSSFIAPSAPSSLTIPFLSSQKPLSEPAKLPLTEKKDNSSQILFSDAQTPLTFSLKPKTNPSASFTQAFAPNPLSTTAETTEKPSPSSSTPFSFSPVFGSSSESAFKFTSIYAKAKEETQEETPQVVFNFNSASRPPVTDEVHTALSNSSETLPKIEELGIQAKRQTTTSQNTVSNSEPSTDLTEALEDKSTVRMESTTISGLKPGQESPENQMIRAPAVSSTDLPKPFASPDPTIALIAAEVEAPEMSVKASGEQGEGHESKTRHGASSSPEPLAGSTAVPGSAKKRPKKRTIDL